MVTITLPVFGIQVEVYGNNGEGSISSLLHEDGDSPEYTAAISGIESFILAAACAGIDVKTPQFLEAIETAVEGITNNYS